jgi:DivIVA domain-containing protein
MKKIDDKMLEIVNKKFNKVIYSGYDPEDVDSFFDKVVAYLNEINSELSETKIYDETVNDRLSKLTADVNLKNSKIAELEGEINDLRKEGFGNLDIHNRLKKMEEKNNK